MATATYLPSNPMQSHPVFGGRKYQLPAVKECLYHPRLPTFRRMDMDTAAHKLPEEHCRTTTKLTASKFYLDHFIMLCDRFPCYSVTIMRRSNCSAPIRPGCP